MILSFGSKETERVWRGRTSRRLPANIQDRALRKLRQLSPSDCTRTPALRSGMGTFPWAPRRTWRQISASLREPRVLLRALSAGLATLAFLHTIAILWSSEQHRHRIRHSAVAGSFDEAKTYGT